MKKYKRIMAILLIIALLITLMPIQKANASVTVVPDDVEDTEDNITYNGITLKMYEILPNSTYGLADLTVEGTNLTDDLAGFSGTVNVLGGHTINSITCLSDNWIIEAQRIDSNFVSMIVEKDDFSTEENEVTVRIKYEIDWETNPVSDWSIGIGNVDGYTEFVTTDKSNNCYYPFENMEVNHTKQVALKVSDNSIISVKTGREKYAKIDEENKRLYIKLNGNSDGFGTVEEFISNIQMPEFWTRFDWCENGSEEFSKGYTSSVSDYEGDHMENINKFRITTEYGTYIYDVYQMGNIWIESSTTSGVINLNDVINFRKAIIKDTQILNSESFEVKNTDVNFSNSELGEIGDIGDVISVRQRILTYNWIDVN